MQSDRHARINDRAYHLWIADGQVHGRDLAHWQQAEREIAEEETRMAATIASRAVRKPPRRAPPAAAAPAPARRSRSKAAPPAP